MTRYDLTGCDATDILPRWESEFTPQALPATHRVAITPRTAGLTGAGLRARNILYSALDVAGAGKQYGFSTPAIDDARTYGLSIGKTVANWTQPDCVAFAAYLDRSGVVCNQFGEHNGAAALLPYAMDHGLNAQQYNWVMEALYARCQLTTPKGVVMEGYGGSWGTDLKPAGIWRPLDAQFVGALSSPAAARAGIDWFNRPMSRYVYATVQMYHLHATRDYAYAWTYAVQRLALAVSDWANNAGVTLGVYGFLWPKLITPDRTFELFTNRYAYEHNLPAGRLYKHDGAAASYNLVQGVCESCLIHGHGLGMWENGVTYSAADPLHHEPASLAGGVPGDAWKPNVAGTPPPPTNETRPHYPRSPQSNFNAPLVAQDRIARFLSVSGPTRFARFRVTVPGFGPMPWVAPRADRADVLAAADLRSGWAEIRQQGSTYAIRAWNPYGDPGGVLWEVDLGDGNTVTFDLPGDESTVLVGARDWTGVKHFPRAA